MKLRPLEGSAINSPRPCYTSQAAREVEAVAYRQLGDIEEPEVVGDGTDDDGNLSLASLLLHVTNKSGQRQRGSVDPRHEETLQHDAVELGVSAASQEPVELENWHWLH